MNPPSRLGAIYTSCLCNYLPLSPIAPLLGIQLLFGNKSTHCSDFLPKIRVLPSFRVIVQGNTYGTSVMPVVLSNNLLTVQFPEARIVVRAGRDKVS